MEHTQDRLLAHHRTHTTHSHLNSYWQFIVSNQPKCFWTAGLFWTHTREKDRNTLGPTNLRLTLFNLHNMHLFRLWEKETTLPVNHIDKRVTPHIRALSPTQELILLASSSTVVLTTKAQAFIYHKLPYHKRCLEIIKRLKQSLLAVIMVLTVYLFFVDMPSYVNL